MRFAKNKISSVFEEEILFYQNIFFATLSNDSFVLSGVSMLSKSVHVSVCVIDSFFPIV